MKKDFNKELALSSAKGFTLIELLVVIAIIGILSGVVLTSLNGARLKAKNAAAKADLTQMRLAAEMIYDSSPASNYADVCTNGNDSKKQFDAAVAVVGNTSSNSACSAIATAWAAHITLLGGDGFFCIDSTGKVGSKASASNACPD